MSGGGDAPPAPNVYQSQFQPAADVGAISNIAGMQQYAGQGQDTYNAWAPAFAGGAVPSGWSPTGTEASARNLVNSGTSLNDWGTRLLGMGFDPQNALYDRSAQQLTDQVRAGQAARGISMTPFGAGLEGKALGDFNIDWQNSAVDRASKAASGASPLFSQGASNILGGEQLSMAVPDLQQRLLTGLLSNQLGAQAIPQQIIKNYLDYLSGAAKGDANAVSRYDAQVKQAKNESDADSAMWGGIGKLAGNLVGAAGFF